MPEETFHEKATQLEKTKDTLINDIYMNDVIFGINRLVLEKSGCRKCEVHSKGYFVGISHHDAEKCLLHLPWEEKVELMFEKAYKAVNHEQMKDRLRERIAEKGLKVDPTNVRLLEETKRPKGFMKKIKDIVIKPGSGLFA